MTLKSFVVFALIVSCTSAARSDDAKDDTLEGTWLPFDGRTRREEIPRRGPQDH